MKHRIQVTVSDPNHSMASMRKEKIQKFVRVGGDQESSVDRAKAHFKKQGYKVHDAEHVGMVNEEPNHDDMMSVKDTYKKIAVKHLKDASRKDITDKQRNYARTMNKRALEAMKMDNHTDALNHYRGVKEDVELDEADTFPVGHDGQTAKSHVKSARQTAETKAKSIANQAVNKSKADAMKEEFKVGHRVIATTGDAVGHTGVITKNYDDGHHEVHFALYGKMKKHKDELRRDPHGQKYEKVQEDAELDEAWSLGNRNPQKGIKVGHKVRSYDFPGMHDDHYIEGHVVGETPHSYHIRVNKVVRGGKEIPTPAHMTNVEAPKGKGMLSNAYGVHKIMAKQEASAAAPEAPKGGAKTFNKVRTQK